MGDYLRSILSSVAQQSGEAGSCSSGEGGGGERLTVLCKRYYFIRVPGAHLLGGACIPWP